MRVPLKELLEKLNVDRELYPYETQPWVHYDEDEGITCSAEVRMGPGGVDVEAEIQFLYDEETEVPELFVAQDEEALAKLPPEDRPAPKPLIINNRMQVMLMHGEPIKDDMWGPQSLVIKGINYTNAMHDWEGKGCSFFAQCVQAINMGEIPDIDALIEKEMQDDSRGGGRRGRIGRKGMKLKQDNPHMGMKKGM